MGAADHRGQGARRASFDAKQQLSEKVAAYIREGVMVGRFRAGEYIRTERLAEELGVSPTPVREALMLLGSEGSVRWEPRRGYRVVPLTTQDVGDLFRVQAFIAGELAARAARDLSEEDLDRLDEIQADLEQAERDGNLDLVETLNHRVHRTINKASGSARLAVLLGVTVNYVPLGYYASIEGWSSASVHDHSAVFRALRARDPEGARKAMAAHIEHVGGRLVEHLRERDVLS
jgi:DNA-binding GntR family transcriptional regulator